MNSKRGMTILEMIVVMGIILVISFALVWMLFFGKKIYDTSLTHGDIRQELQIIISKIADELKDSTIESISTSTLKIDPSSSQNLPRIRAISFLSAYPIELDKTLDRTMRTDERGFPLWQKYVIYYIPLNTTKLLRKEVQISPTLNKSKIPDIDSKLTGDGKLISSNVSFEEDVNKNYILTLPKFYFEFNKQIGSATISITLKKKNPHGKVDEQSKLLKIFLLN